MPSVGVTSSGYSKMREDSSDHDTITWSSMIKPTLPVWLSFCAPRKNASLRRNVSVARLLRSASRVMVVSAIRQRTKPAMSR
ncbi:hypothetical protein D9M71_761510 [compost metagenome]